MSNMLDATDNNEYLCKFEKICEMCDAGPNNLVRTNALKPNAACNDGTADLQCNCCQCIRCLVSMMKRLCKLALKNAEHPVVVRERYSVFEGGRSLDREARKLDGRGDFVYKKKPKITDPAFDELKSKEPKLSSKEKSKSRRAADATESTPTSANLKSSSKKSKKLAKNFLVSGSSSEGDAKDRAKGAKKGRKREGESAVSIHKERESKRSKTKELVSMVAKTKSNERDVSELPSKTSKGIGQSLRTSVKELLSNKGTPSASTLKVDKSVKKASLTIEAEAFKLDQEQDSKKKLQAGKMNVGDKENGKNTITLYDGRKSKGQKFGMDLSDEEISRLSTEDGRKGGPRKSMAGKIEIHLNRKNGVISSLSTSFDSDIEKMKNQKRLISKQKDSKGRSRRKGDSKEDKLKKRIAHRGDGQPLVDDVHSACPKLRGLPVRLTRADDHGVSDWMRLHLEERDQRRLKQFCRMSKNKLRPECKEPDKVCPVEENLSCVCSAMPPKSHSIRVIDANSLVNQIPYCYICD